MLPQCHRSIESVAGLRPSVREPLARCAYARWRPERPLRSRMLPSERPARGPGVASVDASMAVAWGDRMSVSGNGRRAPNGQHGSRHHTNAVSGCRCCPWWCGTWTTRQTVAGWLLTLAFLVLPFALGACLCWTADSGPAFVAQLEPGGAAPDTTCLVYTGVASQAWCASTETDRDAGPKECPGLFMTLMKRFKPSAFARMSTCVDTLESDFSSGATCRTGGWFWYADETPHSTEQLCSGGAGARQELRCPAHYGEGGRPACLPATADGSDTRQQHAATCCSNSAVPGWRSCNGGTAWAARNTPHPNSTASATCRKGPFAAAEEYCRMLHARLCTAAELEAGCGYGMGCETRWREWVIPDRESERPPTRVNRVLPYDNQSHWSSSTVRPALTGPRLAKAPC